MKNAKGKNFRSIAIYTLVFVALVACMYFGSREIEPAENTSNASLASFDDKSLALTADQVSESYIVADVADTISLPSATTNNSNYVTVAAKYEIFGSGANAANDENVIQDKPTLMDIAEISRGVISHAVKEGETLDSIMRLHGIRATKDQVRWSNNMRTEAVSPGSTLYLPSRPGIVYRVGDGDNINSIASRFGSKVEDIVTYNDLEVSNLSPGMLILVPNGVMPETERPEYVAPRSGRYTNGRRSGTYRYASGYGSRQNMIEIGSYSYWRGMYNSTRGDGNRNGFGQCTWYAWWWRRYNMPSNYWLPNAILGNASAWYYSLSRHGYAVGKTPAYGAVFQSTAGYYGHVGVVVGVKPGEYITIREMNYAGPNGKLNHVYESTVSWSDAFSFNYIYGKR